MYNAFVSDITSIETKILSATVFIDKSQYDTDKKNQIKELKNLFRKYLVLVGQLKRLIKTQKL